MIGRVGMTRPLRQFLFKNRLDRGANVLAQPILDWIIPGLIGQQRKDGSIGIMAVAAAGLGGFPSPVDYAAFKFPPPSRHDPRLDRFCSDSTQQTRPWTE